VELKTGQAHAANEPRAIERRGSTDLHPVRRTGIDDCGVISTGEAPLRMHVAEEHPGTHGSVPHIDRPENSVLAVDQHSLAPS
jgi:hypothetical protein